jgi:hypothetical protein
MTDQLDYRSMRLELDLLLLLTAAARAGSYSLPIRRVHELYFLTAVLSPALGIRSDLLEVLKRREGVFISDLQHVLDKLIRRGLVRVVRFSPENDDAFQDATVAVDRAATNILIERANEFDEERKYSSLADEVCVVSFRGDSTSDLVRFDATYGDPTVSANRLVSVLGQDASNASARVVELFSEFAESNRPLSSTERINLYLSHLNRLSDEVKES